ncbi:MAG: T9SS type A sorting domain-containing protein [Bacteroidota bacterium]
MKKNRRQTILLAFMLLFGLQHIVVGQTMICTNLLEFSLDDNGEYDIYPEDILMEGAPYNFDNLQIYNNDTGEGGDFLSVDCNDVGSITVLVDDVTNSNSCLVTVIIVDLSTSVILCPADITITCDMNYTDLSITGEATGNGFCGELAVEYSDIIEFSNPCGSGNVFRRWSIVGNPEVFCDQEIEILDLDIPITVNFDQVGDMEVSGCSSDNGFGEPTWVAGPCDAIGWTVSTDSLPMEEGGCMELTNKYVVINWCDYDPDNPNWDGEGYWEHIQTVVITGCDVNDVVFPNNIVINDENGTIENLSIENLQSIYGYSFEEVHAYTDFDCGDIQYSFVDSELESPAGFKILRTWTAMNWDASESTTYSQILTLNTIFENFICLNSISVSLENGPVTIVPSDLLLDPPLNEDNFLLSIEDENGNIVVDNIVTSEYIGQSLVYSLTNILTGDYCLGNVIVQVPGGTSELTFAITNVTAETGTNICVPVKAFNFNDISYGQGNIGWDSDVLSYTGIVGGGLDSEDFNLNQLNTENGELSFVWLNAEAPVTLNAGEQIFTLCFDVLGDLGESSSVYFFSTEILPQTWGNQDLEIDNPPLAGGNVTVSDTPCVLESNDVSYPLPDIFLSDLNLDPKALTPDDLMNKYNFNLSDVLITWPEENCQEVTIYYVDEVVDYGDGSFQIARTITIIDLLTYDPESLKGKLAFTQMIFAGVDAGSFICDFLPRTAPVGDCESGHSLDDAVEWPADLQIGDYRISPEELVGFSTVDELDSKPSFYGDPDNYNASYVDFLVGIDATSVTVGRLWTVTHDRYNFSWTYDQKIVIDISNFENLVNVTTGKYRAMPGVVINDAISTDLEGDAFVEGQPVNNISYEDEYLNGINILDLVLIQRHILDLNVLSEYELLAADVNQDGEIEASDLSELRDYIVGELDKDKGDWRFYEDEIEPTFSVQPKGIYVGVKSGDVDDSALLLGDVPLDPTAKFEMVDLLLNKGETYSIPVYLNKEFDAFGIEFSAQLNLDLIELNGVTVDNIELESKSHVSENGLFKFISSAVDQGLTIGGQDSDPVLFLEITAKENSLLSLAMDMESHLSFVATSDLELIVVGGNIGDTISTGTNSEELSRLSIFPNPTSDYLNFDLSDVGVSGNLEISIFDASGRRLFQQFNSAIVDVMHLPSGTYYFRLKVDEYSTTGKVLVVR